MAYPSVKNVRTLDGAGPWQTKSGGELDVLFKIPFELLLEEYFHYDAAETNKLHSDIRGLRAYTVSKLAQGSMGANEWHKVRSEMVFVVNGRARWDTEDVYGAKSTAILQRGTGIWLPSFIFHTYAALDNDTEILVIANTLFDPDDTSTHDTYSENLFKQLQREVKEAGGSSTG